MANPAGTPIWFELNTSDMSAATRFYAAVMGWKLNPSPMAEHGGYLLAGAPDGEGVAGVMTPPPGVTQHPGWVIYFAADDVDALAGKVKELGGSVHFGPEDIPHVGRFAMVGDPQGVVFPIMKGSSPEDSTAFKQASDSFGHGVWVELATPDPNAALEFYGELFGWSKQGAMPMGEMGDYTFIGTGEDFRPGAIMSSKTCDVTARWNMYFNVPDIEAAIAAAKDAGGTLIQGPDEIPGGDFSANLTDPQGHPIGIVGPKKKV